MELSEILPTTARRNELMASLPKVTQGEWEKILELETVRNVVAWLEEHQAFNGDLPELMLHEIDWLALQSFAEAHQP